VCAKIVAALKRHGVELLPGDAVTMGRPWPSRLESLINPYAAYVPNKLYFEKDRR
jgi:hypothetical protein